MSTVMVVEISVPNNLSRVNSVVRLRPLQPNRERQMAVISRQNCAGQSATRAASGRITKTGSTPIPTAAFSSSSTGLAGKPPAKRPPTPPTAFSAPAWSVPPEPHRACSGSDHYRK